MQTDARSSLTTVHGLYISEPMQACGAVELYTATSLAKPDSPTGHIMWLSIFEGRIVPPPIDLLHGKV